MSKPRRPKARPVSGWVVLDKPAGLGSTEAVARIRRLFNAEKAGHAGTLDPLASGLLIVLVGKAASLCNQLMDGEKTYLATIDLSHASNTDDLEGVLTPNTVAAEPSAEAIASTLERQFIGVIQQKPPAFSAIWVNAERAYDLARKGKAPEMQPRPVTIHSIRIHSYTFPHLTIEVRCGKGTYIRSLARDIGLAVTGHAACLTALRRTAIGPYQVEHALPFESLPEQLTSSDLREVLPQST